MEKKGELKNCKIFNKKGRILVRLQTEEIMPIIVVGKNESEDIIYREGLYFPKTRIFQTRFSDEDEFLEEEYTISSLAKIEPLNFGITRLRKFTFYSAIGEEIGEAFVDWARLVYYVMKHPEEKEKIIRIAGVLLEPCSPIFKIHVKLENVKDKGFIYGEHEFYELSSKYYE